jgi:hypothetical protein
MHGSLASETTNRSTTVSLQARPSGPAFYLAMERYVLFFDPADVVASLEYRNSQLIHASSDDRLLAAVRAVLPLKRHTDLRSFVFEDTDLRDRPDFLAADLLEGGRAAITDLFGLGRGDDLADIRVVKMTGMGKWRDFCSADGQSILFVTDVIFD